jgi:ribosomal protein S18 acetylase RimI-like enzyme
LCSQGIDQWDEAYPSRSTIETDVASGTAFVAKRAGAVVGVIVLNQHQEHEYATVPWRFTQGPVLVVHRLMVHPDVEGQGLARSLMAFAEKRASTSGYASIRLDAFAENPRAVRLYERLGYRIAGEVRFRKGRFRCFEKDLQVP